MGEGWKGDGKNEINGIGHGEEEKRRKECRLLDEGLKIVYNTIDVT